jgi:hypothetical protein
MHAKALKACRGASTQIRDGKARHRAKLTSSLAITQQEQQQHAAAHNPCSKSYGCEKHGVLE